MKLDHITKMKILRCFRTNGCRKWRTRFKNKKFVVLTEYFKQQTNSSGYRRKISQSRRSTLWRNQSYLPFLIKQMEPCHGAINSRPRYLRTTLEKYFRFKWNFKQKRIEARNSMANCEICFPIFSETIHTISKIFSQHDLRKYK